MARTTITIALELDDTLDVPVGLVRLPDGTERPFHGWLGLSEVIDALIGSDPPAAPRLRMLRPADHTHHWVPEQGPPSSARPRNEGVTGCSTSDTQQRPADEPV